ncbi:MAG: hypothetical protein ACLRI8_10130 [Agathobacter rectalis]
MTHHRCIIRQGGCRSSRLYSDRGQTENVDFTDTYITTKQEIIVKTASRVLQSV